MKTTIKTVLLAASVATMTIVSCKKESQIAPNPTNNNSSVTTLSGLFSQKEAAKQTFTFNASLYNTIKGAKGTKLEFQPGCFKTMSGQPVSGNVTVEMREMFNKSDMIFSKAPTMSNGKILVSGGELFLQAFQNGAQLQLSSPYAVKAKVPTGNNPGPMREFYSNQSYNPDGNLNWWTSDSIYYDSTYTDTDSMYVYTDSIDGDYTSYYNFNLDNMNWINCDYFYDSPGPFTDVEINVGNQFDATNCVVYISFDGINSVAQLDDYDLNHVFNYGYPSIPQGLNVHIVAIANIGGQFYSAFVPATLGANFSTNITLSATTLSQITADVNALP